MGGLSRGALRVQGFKNAEMDFQLMRQLGSAAYHAASVGECVNVVASMPQESAADWVEAFSRLAAWQMQDGQERLKKGHKKSGSDQLLRACNSYRAAEYYAPCDDEMHRQLGLQSANCFVQAIKAMELHFECHALPYKEIMLPVYFFSPDANHHARKTLMIVSGFDGTMEEEFIMRGLAGIARGYNVICFAGPGQMDVFRRYPDTYFEPDFEGVVRTVIDFFATHPKINMNQLALLGISFGGYFATRAACFEPRIKALIANSPILDLHAYMVAFAGFDPAVLPPSQDFTISDLPHIPDAEFPPGQKEQSEQLMIRYGRRSFKNTFEYIKSFQVGAALSAITCPALALIGKAEGNEPYAQFERFCTTTKASSYVFSDFEGASSHCQVGNIAYSNAVMYDWLDEVFV